MFSKFTHRPFAHAAMAMAAVVLIASPAKSQTFDDPPPGLEVGDWWAYRVNGAQNVLLTVIGTESIGGVLAHVSRWDGGPYADLESTVSFDSVFGERLWKNFDPTVFIDGVGFVSQLQLFDPPVNTGPPNYHDRGDIDKQRFDDPNVLERLRLSHSARDLPGAIPIRPHRTY